MACTPLMMVFLRGESTGDSVLPSPSSPFQFWPVPHTSPFWRSRRVCDFPAATARTSVTDSTWTGVARSAAPPSPSAPALRLSPFPVACAVPSVLRKTRCHHPAEIAETSSMCDLCGELLVTVVPSPSCPLVFWPAAMTEPSCSREAKNPSPALTACTPASNTVTRLPFSSKVPSPSWPTSLLPRDLTAPSVVRKTVNSPERPWLALTVCTSTMTMVGVPTTGS
mmetsp:Transcript_23120/g.64599  ORF Transcript_23120/g.64599 Transcript_23120/m.64599 type:complete len:224 (+) Transcript_23120:709-1380(+)